MAQSNLKDIQLKGLIPPNPAALDFESKFRERDDRGGVNCFVNECQRNAW